MRILNPAIFIGALFCSSAYAHDAGDFFVRLGAAQVSPDASSDPVLGGSIDVENSTSLGISGTWFMSSHLGLEVLGALPFEHDLVGAGLLEGVDLGSTKHLPPTVSLQYYPLGESDFQLYVGIGLNYTPSSVPKPAVPWIPRWAAILNCHWMIPPALHFNWAPTGNWGKIFT